MPVVCGRLVAGVAGSNPTRGMDVCLLCLYIVLSCVGRGLCDGLITRLVESYRVSLCVWSRNPERKAKGPSWTISACERMNFSPAWYTRRPSHSPWVNDHIPDLKRTVRLWCSELSSGMYCRVKWLSTDVSEVRTASIIRDDTMGTGVVSPGQSAAGVWRWPLTPSSAEVKNR
jgi:hypothetical protein